MPEADAKDLAQDAWIRAQGAATRGVEIRDATAYLLTVALRLQRTRRRGEASRCRREALVARRDIVTADPSGDAVQAVLRAHICEALGKLPERMRGILLRHVRDGVSLREIAREQGAARATLFDAYTRSVGRLRLMLSALAKEIPDFPGRPSGRRGHVCRGATI